MDKRLTKQIIIGLVFVLIIGGIGYGIYHSFFYVKPTCSDGVQNGQEEGVDCGVLACGIPCPPAIMPIQIISQKLIKTNGGDYDFVAQVYNPNTQYGASDIEYEIDGGSQPIASNFYILPGQTRYLVKSSILKGENVSIASIKINSANWQKLNGGFDNPFTVRRQLFSQINANGISGQLDAVVFNGSDFDFDKVDVSVIVFDNTGNTISTNETVIRTFLSNTERSFRVQWPFDFSARASRFDIEVNTNLFQNSNFIKTNGTQEQFQQYY